MSSKYLTILDLGSQTNIFSNIDDGTRIDGLPSSFNIGKNTYHTLYVRFSCYLLWYNIGFYFNVDKLKWST